MTSSRTLLVLFAAALCAMPAQADAPSSKPPRPGALGAPKRPFAPFDAGAMRAVKRQGEPGTPRVAHPVVGLAAKVPGDGPPPPPLRRAPDLPELALKNPNAAPGLSSNPLYLASLVYSRMLTRVDGPRCQHLPTCSRFASQAVGRHGALGIPLGLDRLIQGNQSSAVRYHPEVTGVGEWARHYDPLENYEFWRPELFTGMPPLVDEEPLDLSSPTTTSSAAAPTSSPPASPLALTQQSEKTSP
jgi:putative component of membrane protein insertase Oxa1/YidC/SpoIIIJ protein YidD